MQRLKITVEGMTVFNFALCVFAMRRRFLLACCRSVEKKVGVLNWE